MQEKMQKNKPINTHIYIYVCTQSPILENQIISDWEKEKRKKRRRNGVPMSQLTFFSAICDHCYFACLIICLYRQFEFSCPPSIFPICFFLLKSLKERNLPMCSGCKRKVYSSGSIMEGGESQKQKRAACDSSVLLELVVPIDILDLFISGTRKGCL